MDVDCFICLPLPLLEMHPAVVQILLRGEREAVAEDLTPGVFNVCA